MPSSSLVEIEVEVGVEVEKFKGRVHYFSGVDGWCGRIENKAISASTEVEGELGNSSKYHWVKKIVS